jgi:hypothetical protein
MKNGEEKRTSPRSAFRQPIRFDLSYDDVQGLITIEQQGFGVDISQHGLGMLTAYPLKKDEVLRLRFPPESAEATPSVFARVAWARMDGYSFRVGLAFLEQENG